jgi:hypothetical protein
MVEGVDAGLGAERRVRDHHVQLVDRELGEELPRLPLRAREPDGSAERQGGGEQPVRYPLRHLVGDADVEAQRPPGRPVLDRVEQLLPEAEDLLGVAVDDPTDVREDQMAPFATEQPLVENVLELADLPAHGRLCEPQLGRRLRDAALTGREPEVEKVVVVEPVHGGP